MADLSKESLKRISTVLLVLTSIFFAAAVGMLAYHLYSTGSISKREAALLSKEELQRKLFEDASKEFVIFPHSVPEIGYVLNKELKQSSWRAAEGELYPINYLGLRGKNFGRKWPSTIRILLVGDSYLFGWKLKEREKLETILNEFCEKRLGKNKIEFITVALPGWNIRSEKAFMESYWHILEPDAVVWSIVSNDLSDVYGCMPPGLMSQWMSPQKTGDLHFWTESWAHENLPIPIIIDRWKKNLDLIRTFSKSTRMPVLYFYWNAQMARLLNAIQDRSGFGRAPFLCVPGTITGRKEFDVTPVDKHPSGWANRRVALAVLHKLAEMKIIPNVKFDSNEQQIINRFRYSDVKVSAELHLKKRLTYWGKDIPAHVSEDISQRKLSILCGINGKKMMKTGVMCLKDEKKSKGLKMTVDVFENKRIDRKLFITVKNDMGGETRSTIELKTGKMEFTVPLPGNGKSKVPVFYEITWKFNFANCNSPFLCYCGNLIQAGFYR